MSSNLSRIVFQGRVPRGCSHRIRVLKKHGLLVLNGALAQWLLMPLCIISSWSRGQTAILGRNSKEQHLVITVLGRPSHLRLQDQHRVPQELFQIIWIALEILPELLNNLFAPKEPHGCAAWKKQLRKKAESETNMSRSRRQDEELAERLHLEWFRAKFKRIQEEEGTNDREAGFSAFVEEEKQRDLKAGHRWPGMTEDEYRQTLRVRFDQDEYRRYHEDFLWLREDNGPPG